MQHVIIRLFVQVEARNKKIGRIKEKYEEKVTEIRDLTEEFQTQREDYLDSIRQQSQETKLLQQILDQVSFRANAVCLLDLFIFFI